MATLEQLTPVCDGVGGCRPQRPSTVDLVGARSIIVRVSLSARSDTSTAGALPPVRHAQAAISIAWMPIRSRFRANDIMW